MATFILICRDLPGALELRMATREAHFAWMKDKQGMVKRAGPILNDAGAMIGSLFFMEAESVDAVRAFNAEDPYSRAGLFHSVEILPWRQTFGEP